MSLTVTSFFFLFISLIFFFIKSFFGFLVLDLYKCLFCPFFFSFLFVVLLKTNWKRVSLFVHMRVCRCSVSLSHSQCFLPQISGLSKLYVCVCWHQQYRRVSSASPACLLEREGNRNRGGGSAHWQILIPNYFCGWRVWGLLFKKDSKLFFFI